MSKNRLRSFSLIEVVVAVGVFAVGVVIVITLLGSMGSSVRAVTVETSADRILNFVDWELGAQDYDFLEGLSVSDFFSPKDELRFDPEKSESSFFEIDVTPRTVPLDSAYLEFGVSVSWPVYREDGQFVELVDRKSLFFVTIVNR